MGQENLNEKFDINQAEENPFSEIQNQIESKEGGEINVTAEFKEKDGVRSVRFVTGDGIEIGERNLRVIDDNEPEDRAYFSEVDVAWKELMEKNNCSWKLTPKEIGNSEDWTLTTN